jgi:hypothetical protein
MAATLDTRTTDAMDIGTMRAALAQLHPGSVAHNLLADALCERAEVDAFDEDVHRAEYAAERAIEDRGYDEARGQEAFDARYRW